ncbi:MAG: chemotaxis protein CheW [Nitrospirae bacterium]|nr:chemotaxis protein CheW [Nitrospirota bacterium]
MGPENTSDAKQTDEFSMDAMPDEIVVEFLAETKESLDGIESDFIALEEDPGNTNLINNIFRIIHSMKGAASFIGFKNLENVSHKAEDVLNKLRKTELVLTPAIMDTLLNAVDILKLILKDIEENRKDTSVDSGEIVGRLLAVAAGNTGNEQKPPATDHVITPVSAVVEEPVQTVNQGGSEAATPDHIELLTEMISPNIIDDFLEEAREGLQKLEVFFVTLEKGPDNKELLNDIFRVIHSIKGSAALLCFKNLEGLAHKAEDLLNKLRKGEIVLTPSIMDALLRAVDVIKTLLKNIEKNKKDSAVSTEEIKKILESLICGTAQRTDEACGEKHTETVSAKKDTSDLSMEKETVPTAAADNASVAQCSTSPSPSPSAEIKSGNVKSQVHTVKEDIRSVRISVEKLDYLFNLIGELVLSRNRNIQLHRILSKRYSDDDTVTFDLTEAGSHLNQLTSEIQWAVMKTRMLPVSSVFSKFKRVVRDISRNLGKELELETTGEDTEIDKNIIEGIGDPLTHLIRNSADHGIERPDERVKAGKPRNGTIKLDAYYEENSVVISIKDDGKGIDVDAVRSKSIEKGLIKAEGADKLSKQALLNLIFAPGLSTSQNVTAVSGRGVGMDVVKTNIEKLRGQIIVDSEVGIGTEVKMKIPLTLAILDTLIIKISDQRYAVPLSNVVETHRIKFSQIETVRGSMIFRMRNELLPLVLLSDVFNLPYRHNNNSEVTIVVLKHGLLRMGLVVDKTAGQEEVVIKTLDCLDGISKPDAISGATILGYGSITFILDVDALMKIAKATENRLASDVSMEKNVELWGTDTINVVLVDNLGKEQYAIPARNIREIEMIHKTDIEEIGGRLMIKYRGVITPLTTIASFTNVSAQREFDRYYMVILTNLSGPGNKEAGLLVGRMLGIKKMEVSSINTGGNEFKGTTGSVIFNGRITLLLNIGDVIGSAFSATSSALAGEISTASMNSKTTGHILVVDDVKTHRSILEDVVKAAGYSSVSAEDGLDALNKLNDSISLILTDLEMPNMNGYEFTREAKKRYPGIPVLMVTSMSGEEDRAKGLEAGVDKYLVKWDKDDVLRELKRHLREPVI